MRHEPDVQKSVLLFLVLFRARWSYLTIGQDDIGCRMGFAGFPRFFEDPP